ncbi:MAG: TonB-dependent receptor plug domain-containing protein, partial [Candidatus Binatia bacterium]
MKKTGFRQVAAAGSLLIFTLVTLVIQHTGAMAQEKKEEVFRLEEITVTATKTERDIFDTPGEVSIVTLEEIERVQAQSLDDVVRYLPGVEIDKGPRRIGAEPVIRGMDSERILVT